MKKAGVLIIQSGRVAYANKAAASMTGMDNLSGMTKKGLSKSLKLDGSRFVQIKVKKRQRWIEVIASSVDFKGRPSEMLTLIRSSENKVLKKAKDELEKKLLERNQELFHSNQSLKYMSEFNQKIIDSIPDELVVIDPISRRILRANNQVYNSARLTAGEVIGRKCSDIFHQGHVVAMCPMESSMKSGKTIKRDVSITVEGSKKHLSVITSPIRDEKGKIVQILHMVRDITERKLAEEMLKQSEEKYRRLVHDAPIGIITFDRQGRIIDCNKNIVDILGFSTEKALRDINAFTYEPLVKSGLSSDLKDCFSKKSVVVAERPFENPKRVHIRYHLTPIKNPDNSIFVQALVEDNTERIDSEAEMKKMNISLLTLYTTSSLLQDVVDIEQIVDIAIKTFKSIGFDRVRFYLMKEGRLVGAKASYMPDEKFRKITIELGDEKSRVLKALTEKEPLLLKEDASDLNSELAASLPLFGKEKITGLISIDNRQSRRPIKRDDLHYLMTFANQIAAAIMNVELHELNQRRLRRLSALYDVSSQISGTLDMEKLLNLIVIRIVKVLKVDMCAIRLLDDGRLRTTAEYSLTGLKIPKETLGDEAIDKNEMQYIRELEKSKHLKKKMFKKCRIKSVLCLPLRIENNPIGVVNLYSKEMREFNKHEISLLRTICNQASVFIDNSKLYGQIMEDKDNLGMLLDISQSINSVLDEARLFSLILNKTMEFTKADFGFLMLIEDSELRVKLLKGFDKNRMARLHVKIGEGIAGTVAKTGKPIIVNDVKEDKNYIEISKDIKSEAAIPLIMQNKVIGVLDLESKRYANFKRVQKSLNILTNQIAIAIENARLYDQVKNFNTRLKEEVNLATKELRQKNIELQKMDELKSDFVSNVSHELRTPLTSISGYTKLMLLGRLGSINNKQKESLDIIVEESERLTRLINNVLDLSKLESGKIKFKLEYIDINDILENTIQGLVSISREKNIKINLSRGKLSRFKASPDLVKQVFVNLINNAIKFTPVDGRIKIRTGLDGDKVWVSIKDNGPGIKKELIPKLFDKFYQVDSSMTRQHGGTGLGLVIVKLIAEAHKGKIDVKSELGKGSEFTLWLPYRK